MSSSETVAVVIRAHNYGRYLGEALESVFAQTRPVDEIVVVDDASTDDTGLILRKLEVPDNRLRVIHHTERRGPARSFNAGVAATTASLLLALDADDRLSPSFVELTEAALAAHRADVAYTGARLFGEREGWLPALPFDDDAFRTENLVLVSSLFRRWILDASCGFDERFDRLGYEDWDFWLTAAEQGAVMVPVHGCWLEYRRHARSRNTIRRATALRAHLLVYRKHESVRVRHLARWMGRSVRRNLDDGTR